MQDIMGIILVLTLDCAVLVSPYFRLFLITLSSRSIQPGSKPHL